MPRTGPERRLDRCGRAPRTRWPRELRATACGPTRHPRPAPHRPILSSGPRGTTRLPRTVCPRARIPRVRERRPLHQLHHQGERAVALLDTVDLRDVGMVECRQRLRLALEARPPLGIRGQQIRQDLDRDVAIELDVARAIDLAHSAFADLGLDPVMTEKGTDHGRVRLSATARPRRSSRENAGRAEAGPPWPSRAVTS